MTRNEIVQFVCAKVGQTDARSLDICTTFVQRRYQMIYDTELWRDTQTVVSAETIAGSNLVDFPVGIDRIVSIRINDTDFLEPVDDAFILENDPSAFERAGIPTAYSELASDLKYQIKLYPVPSDVFSLLIVGKQQLVPLDTPNKVPLIRNIDNCLIAFVHGDMLQRQRQYGKAKELYEEAASQLELMRKVEQGQANRSRRSKAVTVSGDSLAELTDAVCARCGVWTMDYVILVREFLRRNYQQIYDMQLWQESLVVAEMDRDDSEVILPEYFDTIISIRANSQLAALNSAEQSLYFGLTPRIFEESGSPVAFSLLTPVAVAVLPAANEQLNLVSTANDKSKVFIRGETGGVEVSETLTLNGAVPVKTENTYDTPLTIAKGITLGDVEISGKVSGTFFQRILAKERERKHIRIWLRPTPPGTESTTCLVMGKRRIRPLFTEEDTPILRGLGTVLIYAAAAELFTRLGNKESAADAQAKAEMATKVLLNRQTEQTAYAPRILPSFEGAWSDDDGSSSFHERWFLPK